MHALDSRLFVFSTQRAIMSFYASLPQGLMPKAMGIEELFSRAFFTPSKSAASSHIYRILLHTILRDLLELKPSLTKLLVFERSFLGYLQGSEFLLPFFREIACHNVAMSEIPLRDIYADYEEHLEILEEIYTRFIAKLDELGLGWFDDKQEVVKEFVQGFSQIELYLDGLLSPIEREKLCCLSVYRPLHIHIQTDHYNYKYFSWLSESVEPGFSYTFVLDSSGVDSSSSAKVISQAQIPQPALISALSFELRLGQCSFVLEKVRELLASGVSGDEILIITPDESFSKYFALLDSARNLNYAMGKDFLSSAKNRAWYDALYATMQGFTQPKGSSLAFIESIFSYIFTQSLAKDSSKSPLDSSYKALLDELPPCPISVRLQAKVLEIIGDYLRVEGVLDFSYEQLLELVFLRLAELSVDDVRGGKVRVMGILETRGLACDYAIVVDCNSGFIPRIKESDVFLNTAIRERLQMPTLQDRENLQKHYYYQLFSKTRKGVFLTFTHNEESRESSLLDELELQGIAIKRDNGDNLYALFPPSSLKPYAEEEIVGLVKDFTFSPTSLAMFMECKRKFYYRYIARLKEPDLSLESSLEPKDLGVIVHNALEQAFGAQALALCDEKLVEKVWQECLKALGKQLCDNATQGFDYELIAQGLKGIFTQEKAFAKRYGFRVAACEQGFSSSICAGGMHYQIAGKIDRIDILADGSWRVIDYKFSKPSADGKIKAKHLSQLAFYRLALESSALRFEDSAYAQGLQGAKPSHIESLVYYLKESKTLQKRVEILAPDAFEEHRALIIETLAQMSQEVCFEKVQDGTKCQYCTYINMCNRS